MLIIGCLAIAVFCLVLLERRREARHADDFFCGCGHHLCFHDERGCGFVVEDDGWANCNCKRYIGPLPIDDQLDGMLMEDSRK